MNANEPTAILGFGDSGNDTLPATGGISVTLLASAGNDTLNSSELVAVDPGSGSGGGPS